MSGMFEARYTTDECVRCGWAVRPGQMAQYDDEDNVVHVICPEAGLHLVGEVCGTCFQEKAASGACGCD